MTLNSTDLRELEMLIADRIFIQIANWNLYLGDAGLAETLALECNVNLGEGSDIAARKAIEALQVLLAGGSSKLPLARLIPSSQISDLAEILEPYCR